MLRPGGLVLLVELDYQPVADGKRAPEGPASGAPFASGAPGWFAVWDAYRRALAAHGVDPAVPRRLGQLVWGTRAYDMSKTFAQEAEIPIGFYPKGTLSSRRFGLPSPLTLRLFCRPNVADSWPASVDGL